MTIENKINLLRKMKETRVQLELKDKAFNSALMIEIELLDLVIEILTNEETAKEYQDIYKD